VLRDRRAFEVFRVKLERRETKAVRVFKVIKVFRESMALRVKLAHREAKGLRA
jgi:hypothetical protein